MSVMTPPGLAIELDEDRLGLGRDRALEGRDVVGLRPHHVPAEVLERVVELVDRAAVELLGGDELVARLHQAVEDDHLRGVAGGDREPGGAAFERGDALLQHGVGRIADARIDVAEGLQAEQRGGVVDVLEHERRRLIDRRRARAGCRIGLRAGVDGERRKAWDAVGHGRSSYAGTVAVRGCLGLSDVWGASRRAKLRMGRAFGAGLGRWCEISRGIARRGDGSMIAYSSRSSFHSISMSARASRMRGTVRPSALAVLRLITNSNLSGP